MPEQLGFTEILNHLLPARHGTAADTHIHPEYPQAPITTRGMQFLVFLFLVPTFGLVPNALSVG